MNPIIDIQSDDAQEDAELKTLLTKMEEIVKNIERNNAEFEQVLEDTKRKIDEQAAGLDAMLSELDAMDIEAEAELDRFILEQAEDLAAEDEDEKEM